MVNLIEAATSPEGCAAILWKHRKHAPEALKLNAGELKKLNLIDEVIAESTGGAHRNPEVAAENLRAAIVRHLDELTKIPTEKLLAQRYENSANSANLPKNSAQKSPNSYGFPCLAF